ncbi:MAG: ubiquinol-cytochrome c reductase iron-sulfur subunit [Planctomycetaceae bacterium]
MSRAVETADFRAPKEPRRSLIQRWPSALMAFGLTLGYGTFAAFVGRFLFPSEQRRAAPQYVANLGSFRLGESMTYVSPGGERVVLSRVGEAGTVDDFIALSSVCPHLGCQVHWEGQNNRFFCPCHNGAFDPAGNPIEGPPKDANQPLPRYQLHVENGLLFIDASTRSLVSTEPVSGNIA